MQEDFRGVLRRLEAGKLRRLKREVKARPCSARMAHAPTAMRFEAGRGAAALHGAARRGRALPQRRRREAEWHVGGRLAAPGGRATEGPPELIGVRLRRERGKWPFRAGSRSGREGAFALYRAAAAAGRLGGSHQRCGARSVARTQPARFVPASHTRHH